MDVDLCYSGCFDGDVEVLVSCVFYGSFFYGVVFDKFFLYVFEFSF